MSTAVQSLKSTIADLSTEGRAARAIINNTHGRDRYDAWMAKREVGSRARYHLLAYAVLRERPYAETESLTPMDADARQRVAIGVAWALDEQPTKESIKKALEWMSVPPTDAERARRTTAEAAGLARLRERRASSHRGRRVGSNATIVTVASICA